MALILDLKDVHIGYGRADVVKGISLQVEENNIVVLIGANGAGKTTTLSAIAGLNKISAGEIWFLGENISGSRSNRVVEAGITLVPEGRRIFPYMTVHENLMMGAYTRKDRIQVKKDLEDVLEQFPRLKERINQKGGTLSGGEQQMLAIGRGLMAKPSLMLLDEPTMGLSPLLAREIAEIIRSINKKNVSILLVEQNAEMALEVAHKGYVMQTGRIVLEGNAEDLIHNTYVKEAYLGG